MIGESDKLLVDFVQYRLLIQAEYIYDSTTQVYALKHTAYHIPIDVRSFFLHGIKTHTIEYIGALIGFSYFICCCHWL